jgi:signal transduction histidine kinase
MAIPADVLYTAPNEIVNNLSFLVNILQAVGIAIGVYIIFNTINFFLNRKKQKEIVKINKNLEDIKRLLAKNSKRK